jgi:hypothetical protein
MFSLVAKYQLIYIVYASQLNCRTCRAVQCRQTLFCDAHRILIVGFCQTQEAEAAPFGCPWLKTTFIHLINFVWRTLSFKTYLYGLTDLFYVHYNKWKRHAVVSFNHATARCRWVWHHCNFAVLNCPAKNSWNSLKYVWDVFQIDMSETCSR